jgi:hypothetical protein
MQLTHISTFLMKSWDWLTHYLRLECSEQVSI